MVNSSTNINKMNTRLPPQIVERKQDHVNDVGNACPCLGQPPKCTHLKTFHSNVVIYQFCHRPSVQIKSTRMQN